MPSSLSQSAYDPFYFNEIPCTDRRWFQIAKLSVIGTVAVIVFYGVIAYIIFHEADWTGKFF